VANIPISGLPALGTVPAIDDLLVVVDVSDTSEAPTGTTKKLTTAILFTTPSFSGSTTMVGGTVLTSSPVLNATQTWNGSGVAFTAVKLNVTDTASSNTSLLLDLEVGAVSKFSVNKFGIVNPQTNGFALGSGVGAVQRISYDLATTTFSFVQGTDAVASLEAHAVSLDGLITINIVGKALNATTGASNAPSFLDTQSNTAAGDTIFGTEGPAGTTFNSSTENAGIAGTVAAKPFQLGANSTVALTINTDGSVALSGTNPLKAGATALINLDANGVINLGAGSTLVKTYLGAAYAGASTNHGTFGVDTLTNQFFWVDNSGNRRGTAGTIF
jgi:hypothetical protein